MATGFRSFLRHSCGKYISHYTYKVCIHTRVSRPHIKCNVIITTELLGREFILKVFSIFLTEILPPGAYFDSQVDLTALYPQKPQHTRAIEATLKMDFSVNGCRVKCYSHVTKVTRIMWDI